MEKSKKVSIPSDVKQKGRPRPTKINKLRYAEYYGQQEIQDALYQKSLNGEKFNKLMSTITSDANIIMAYRSIKRNAGSKTPGTDGLTIRDIEKLEPEAVCQKVRNILANYNPRKVRRKDIPKPNGKTRPLGIPCIWDRLIQQCILQVLEPICEAKFFGGSFGFRPLRSAENAINKELSFPNAYLLQELAKNPVRGRSIEYNDNRVSLFSGQQGKCYVTGYEFLDLSEIHCHHRHPRSQGGGDNYMNLKLVLTDVHRLIHAKKENTIKRYMEMLKLDEKQLSKLNQLRKEAGLDQIKAG